MRSQIASCGPFWKDPARTRTDPGFYWEDVLLKIIQIGFSSTCSVLLSPGGYRKTKNGRWSRLSYGGPKQKQAPTQNSDSTGSPMLLPRETSPSGAPNDGVVR